MVATVGLCCCRRSPALCSFDSMAGRLAPTTQRAFTAAIAAGLKPRSSVWAAHNSTVQSPGRGRFEEHRLVPRGWALSSRVGAAAAAGQTYYTEGGGAQRGRPSSASEQVYEQYGQPLERAALPRPPTVEWEKDLANAVQLIGRVGRDVDVKYLDNGKVVANTSLAVHRPSNRSNRKEETSWFQLEIWDALAEVAAHHVAKGEQIFVTGRIVVDEYVKDEVQYTVVKVVVRDICYVEPYSGPRQGYQSNDDSAAMGSGVRAQEEAPNPGSSQRNWNQQQLASQPSQGTAMQKGSSNSSVEALATEKRWQEYFADPTQWWDNRLKKRNPKSPDFKHKSTQEALWIKSWNNPTWVEQQLAVLDEKKAQISREFGDSDGRSQSKKLSSFKDSDFF